MNLLCFWYNNFLLFFLLQITSIWYSRQIFLLNFKLAGPLLKIFTLETKIVWPKKIWLITMWVPKLIMFCLSHKFFSLFRHSRTLDLFHYHIYDDQRLWPHVKRIIFDLHVLFHSLFSFCIFMRDNWFFW